MKFVQQSRREPRYFENEDGSTYLPIGLNLCFIRDSERRTEEENLGIYRSWMTEFAKNGGNFIRIWLGVPFFDIMPERAGEFSEKNLSHIRFVVDLAEKLGIRIKFTLEHFRRIGDGNDPEGFPGVVDIREWFPTCGSIWLPRSAGGCIWRRRSDLRMQDSENRRR